MPLVIMGGINNLGAREPTAASRVVDPVRSPGPTVRVRMGEGADQDRHRRCVSALSSLRPPPAWLAPEATRGDGADTTGGRRHRAHGPGTGPGRDRSPPHAAQPVGRLRGRARRRGRRGGRHAAARRSRTPRSRPSRAAGDRARGATAYVTLEPCAHHGRTPPVRRRADRGGRHPGRRRARGPRPARRGQGIAQLRERGVTVDVGIGADAARPPRSRRTSCTAAPAAPSPC